MNGANRMFEKITLNQRMVFLCLLIATLVFMIGCLGLYSIQFMSAKYTQLNLLNSATTTTVNPHIQQTLDQSLQSLYWMNGSFIFVSVFGIFMIGYLISLRLTKNIQSILDRLSQVSHEVNFSALDVYDSAEALSSSVIRQSSALQETAAAGTALSEMVKNNSTNSDKAKQISEQSHTATQKGQEAVEKTITGIHEIHHNNLIVTEEIQRNNQELSQIVTLIQEIGNKTKIINDIVFQTKLLAFNASVEAARAGEQGKGFSVVAQEVGNLAQTSGNAAQEITKMLDTSIQRVETMITQSLNKMNGLIQSGKAKVDQEIETANICGQILTELVQNVSLVNNTMGEIASATHEQAKGLEEISKAVGALENTNQQNSTTTQKVSHVTMDLAKQSETQRMLIWELLKMVHGTKKMFTHLDFDGAVSAHLSWKFRLSRYIEHPDGSLKSQLAEQVDTCVLGKWIHGAGLQNYAKQPCFHTLQEQHHQFHKLLGHIIQLADQKQPAEAKEMLSSNREFGHIATTMSEALKAMSSVTLEEHGGTKIHA